MKNQCESCQQFGKGTCNAFKCIVRNYCDWEEIKRPKELDWTDIVKNIFFANGVKCDNEQFLIEDINNLIKEVQEETRKETQNETQNEIQNEMLDWFNRSVIGYPDEKQRFMVKVEKIKINGLDKELDCGSEKQHLF